MHLKLLLKTSSPPSLFYTSDLLGRKDKAIKPKKAPAEII